MLFHNINNLKLFIYILCLTTTDLIFDCVLILFCNFNLKFSQAGLEDLLKFLQECYDDQQLN